MGRDREAKAARVVNLRKTLPPFFAPFFPSLTRQTDLRLSIPNPLQQPTLRQQSRDH
jgi:hypothetical protein